MEEKLQIPDLTTVAVKIAHEYMKDLREQRIMLAKRLMNLPEEVLAEIHLREWYHNYWYLANNFRRGRLPEEERELCKKIIAEAPSLDTVHKQYAALALILFEKETEAWALADKNLWPKKLREDMETFMRWNKLGNFDLELKVCAAIVRNRQIKNFLLEKYSALLEKYSTASAENCQRAEKFRVWYCWFQGEENLPPLVQCCYKSLRENSGAYEICFIDEKNFADYVELPPHILKKFAEGKISRTHLSDILRVNLLARHGGLWLDATILVTEPLESHRDLLERRYFTQKFYREKSNDAPKIYVTNPSYGRWATFAQGSAYRNYPLFEFMAEFYAQYWAEFDSAIDYVLMDFAMELAYEKISAVRADMDAVPVNNPDTNTLIFKLNLPYAQYPYEKILAETFLHKLNWRVNLNLARPDTVYKKIRQKYLGE